MSNLKLGLVGLDTSHVIAFTRLLNEPEGECHVPGGRVLFGFPGGSPDFELSRSRVQGFTEQLRGQFAVSILDSPEGVAEAADAVLLTSSDGRIHLEQFRQVAPSGKPTFIDKPLAVTSEDAIAIVELARQREVPLMSSSSLRYAQPLVEALKDDSRGSIIGADCSGPMPLEPTQPGLFWYGIHTVEMLYTILGPGCRQVAAVGTQDHDVFVGEWKDGRIGTVRGYRNASSSFGVLVHRQKGIQFVDAYHHPRPPYASLLEHVMEMFTTRKPPIPLEETVEIIRFIEAANQSRETGRPVAL